MRYFLEIAYKGTNYHGWQIQNNANSVQEELNKALHLVLRKPIETLASGRTDAGVHAEQQFAHIELDFPIYENLVYKLNRVLPHDIVIKNYYPVTETAHARFDAISRTYEYRINCIKSPFLINLSYFFHQPLDIQKMNEACAFLLSENDFQSFSKVHTDVNHFLCKIHQAFWQEKDQMLIFTIEGNRFLRGMVRAIVGTMLEVGLSRMSVKEFHSILLSKDRKKAGRAAPPDGLFLTKIKYPDSIFLSNSPT